MTRSHRRPQETIMDNLFSWLLGFVFGCIIAGLSIDVLHKQNINEACEILGRAHFGEWLLTCERRQAP